MNKVMRKSALLLSVLLGGFILTSCSSASNLTETAPSQSLQEGAPLSQKSDTASQKAEAAPVPRQLPQLIKKASISVIVSSVDKSVDTVSQIIKKQQGDLIGLEEQQPKDNDGRHRATIQMRVPQNLLEATLDELGKLGTPESRNITAEDVGNQLVDFQARLSNLRATETNLQKIMERSGSVKDVLSVAKELSNVRESIEQINAQLKSLQNQVAYSTITLNLEAAVSSNSPQRGLGSQIQETWNNSTGSVGGFTVGLMKLSIWLLAYSPYLLIIIAGGYGVNRWRRRNSRHLTPTPESANSDS
jgi:Domain of unknown function (DUF4349)